MCFSLSHRPKSSLSRGGARTPATSVQAIEETDENAPEPEKIPEVAPPAPEEPIKPSEETLKEVTRN